MHLSWLYYIEFNSHILLHIHVHDRVCKLIIDAVLHTFTCIYLYMYISYPAHFSRYCTKFSIFGLLYETRGGSHRIICCGFRCFFPHCLTYNRIFAILISFKRLFLCFACFKQVDESGRYTGEYTTVALSGAVRQRGESDACMNRLMHEKKILSFSK